MKNLILLNENRHCLQKKNNNEHLNEEHIEHADHHNDKALTPSEYDNSYIISIVSNPSVDHNNSLPDIHSRDICHYVLTNYGVLMAVDARDSIIWSTELSEASTEADDSFFQLIYNESLEALIALSHSGNIISVDPVTGTDELIGSFEPFGILAGEWRSDGEILALVTFQVEDNATYEILDDEEKVENNSRIPVLMTMNTQFEILSEITLPPLPDSLSPSEELAFAVCWKGDGTLLALSMLDNSVTKNQETNRVIRIYNAETLELSSVGRTEDGSGKIIPNLLTTCSGLLQWSGIELYNMLAAVQRKGKKSRIVVFIEPNGLQHGSFNLCYHEGEEVKRLDFNGESDLCAVSLLCPCNKSNDGSEKRYGKVQLYHRCNYHWYLKWEINYQKDGYEIGFVKFEGYDMTVTLKRYIHQQDVECIENSKINNFAMEWRHYTFNWDISSSPNATATVVDRNMLNFTHFNKAIVPPPMYAGSLSMNQNILAVAHVPIYYHYLENEAPINLLVLVVYLGEGRLVFCGNKRNRPKIIDGNCTTPNILGTVDITSSIEDVCRSRFDETCLRHLTVVNVRYEGESDIFIRMIVVACPLSLHDSEEALTVEYLNDFTVHLSYDNGLDNVSPDDKMSAKVIRLDCYELEGKVLRICNWSNKIDNKGGALIELSDGALYDFSFSESDSSNIGKYGTITPFETDLMLLEPCPSIAGIDVEGGSPLIIGLSSRFRLYCGDRLLNASSSSFILSTSHKFVSYITMGSRSQLRFIPLSLLVNFDPLMGSDDNLVVTGEGYEPRNVERGSRLVVILPEKPVAVLQLPRGNLEGIYPRALVLPYLMSCISKREFAIALDMMRRHKVDMNLVVDINPVTFLENSNSDKNSMSGVQHLVGQVQNIDHLNLFIAGLSNENITEWRIQVPPWFQEGTGVLSENESGYTNINGAAKTGAFDFATKVNQVCSKMRDAMIETQNNGVTVFGESIDNSHFLQPILSTFAKENPPKLEDALALIKDDAIKNISSNAGAHLSPLITERAQKSIQYLAFLADYEIIFNAALGTYDFDLAKAVGRNSQMDPKVYLTMLKRLKGMPEFFAKYEVDVKLKRYESALTHLFKAGGESPDNAHFGKCLEFLQQHNLHRLGLKLFDGRDEYTHLIMVSLGEHLLSSNKADLALAIFLATTPSHLDGARRAARVCGDWKSYFACSLDYHDSSAVLDSERQEVALEIAEEIAAGKGGLLSRRDGYASAARILIDYCQDIGGAIDMLISAEMWFEGRRLAALHSDVNFLENVIEAAVSYGQSCLDDFESKVENFENANDRYALVLDIRKQAKREGEQGIEEENDETGSLFSVASHASNGSVSSNMSSSSIGSISSVSSMISLGGVSSFSLVGDLDAAKHKSKFNKIGRQKKKRKSKKERNKMKKGSEEELKSLVNTLKNNIVDEEYLPIIVETIQFLAQVGKITYAKEIYDAYELLKKAIEQSQSTRRSKDLEEKASNIHKAYEERQNFDHIILDCEDEVNSLCCSDIAKVVHDFFSFLMI